jgi:hypothetical protein
VTEQEWDRCADPEVMLECLLGRASDRKLRLFAASCCRRIWHLLEGERNRRVVEAVEAFADELIGSVALEVAREAAQGASSAGPFASAAWSAAHAADAATAADLRAGRRGAPTLPPMGGEAASVAHDAADAVGSSAADGPAAAGVPKQIAESARDGALASERRCQAELLRCIFGNPVRPVAADPAWRAWHGGAIPKLAQAVYQERDVPSGHLDAARLAVLADMLEEAGCSDPQLLGHLRGPGPHLRGCFALDLQLGKT